jgi:hypothetical protein
MLRTVFIGSKNDFDDVLVDWLAQRTELVGAIWLDPERWRKSWRGRLGFVRKRLKRRGVRRTIDEAAFYLVYQRFFAEREERQLEELFIRPYRAEHELPRWDGDTIEAEDVNAPEVIDFLRARQPDVALAMCVNNYFGRELRSLFQHGVLLWHEGFTPEYKGLWSPFWAIHNLDFERIGYSLLRMNDEYDAGEVFVQGRAQGIDPVRHGSAYAGHKAIADSLPAVERFLAELEAGTAVPLDRNGAASNYYSYPGLTDLVRLRRRLRRVERVSGAAVETAPE